MADLKTYQIYTTGGAKFQIKAEGYEVNERTGRVEFRGPDERYRNVEVFTAGIAAIEELRPGTPQLVEFLV